MSRYLLITSILIVVKHAYIATKYISSFPRCNKRRADADAKDNIPGLGGVTPVMYLKNSEILYDLFLCPLINKGLPERSGGEYHGKLPLIKLLSSNHSILNGN